MTCKMSPIIELDGETMAWMVRRSRRGVEGEGRRRGEMLTCRWRLPAVCPLRGSTVSALFSSLRLSLSQPLCLRKDRESEERRRWGEQDLSSGWHERESVVTVQLLNAVITRNPNSHSLFLSLVLTNRMRKELMMIIIMIFSSHFCFTSFFLLFFQLSFFYFCEPKDTKNCNTWLCLSSFYLFSSKLERDQRQNVGE